MKKSLIILFCIGLSFTSCKDFLTLVPKGSKVVSTVEDVKTELVGYWSACIYYRTPILSYGTSSNLSLPLYNDVNTHLAIYGDDLDLLMFNRHADISSKVMSHYYQDVDWKGLGLAYALWSASYCSIGFMNAILDDLAVVSHTREQYETIGGEARLIRAWCLFKLIQFFAPYQMDAYGVPLNTDSNDTQTHPRSSQTDLYAFIEKELNEVGAYTAPSQAWNFFYNEKFINSFRAEMYMFRAMSAAGQESDWQNAELYSGKVIADYHVEDRAELLSSLFTKDATQYTTANAYCAVRLATTRSNSIGAQYTGIWGKNNAQQPGADLWNLYTENDIRKKAWFEEVEEDGMQMIYVAKPRYSSEEIGDLVVLYRKAELYLIHCEALCRQHKENEAAALLLAFRQKRIPGYTGPIGSDVLEEVLKERRRELCMENGIRWLDMKRLGLSCTREGYSDEDTKSHIYTLRTDDYRYALPIPTDLELDYNKIPQNPGWTSFE